MTHAMLLSNQYKILVLLMFDQKVLKMKLTWIEPFLAHAEYYELSSYLPAKAENHTSRHFWIFNMDLFSSSFDFQWNSFAPHFILFKLESCYSNVVFEPQIGKTLVVATNGLPRGNFIHYKCTVVCHPWVILKSSREMISLFLLIFHSYVVKGQLTLDDLNTKLGNLETKFSNLEQEVKVRII